MPPADHHKTDADARRCPICQLLIVAKAWAIYAKMQAIVKGRESD